MAYERKIDTLEIGGESLDVFVDGALKTLQVQSAVRNAEQESKFISMVLDGNLTLEEQLDYRKEQLKAVSDDPAERRRIRQEISNLNGRIEAKKYSDGYLQKLIDTTTGVSSVDNLLGWLRDQRAATKNPETQAAIDKSIFEQESKKFELQQAVIKNQTEYALNDKTGSLVDTQIGKVSAAKSKAILAGQDDVASNLDLQLQALKKAKTEYGITNAITNFAVSTITGAANATALLDSYNSKISSGATSGAITIGGTTYNSEKEFWTYQRDTYLASNATDGFFPRMQDEQKTQIKVKNSNNILTNDDIKTAASAFDSLLTRPELQPFLPKIQAVKQDIIQAGVDLRSDTITNTYAKDLDVNNAINQLTQLQKLGGNVDKAQTQIITAAAETKQAQLSGILATVKELTDPLKNANPLTAEEAIKQALATGSSSINSPQELVNKSEAQLAQEAAAKSKGTEFTADARTTINPLPATPQQTTTPTPSTPTPAQPTPTATPNPTPTPQSTTPAVTPPATTVANPQPSIPFKFTTQFDLGAKDAQVKELQKFLNKQGFTVATVGAGSVGNETDYFGPATQAALQKFQSSHGIVTSGDPTSTGYGRLGPQTLAKINELMAKQ